VPSVEHPLIAINGEMELAKGSSRLLLSNRYADAVLRAGGVPVAIVPVGGPRDIERLLERVDGLVLGGGDDLDLERLRVAKNHPAQNPILPAKQDFDVELVRAALERGLPMLAICYGMQLLSVIGGGGLHQHLPDDRPGLREHRGGTNHPVIVERDSKLGRLVQTDELDVVSSHHQGVASVGPDWLVCARDDQGLIEAIEDPARAFAIGVQWHPERSPEGSPHDRLFRGLVGAAGVAASRASFSTASSTARAPRA
jgi:putative glutamine amidotransferase